MLLIGLVVGGVTWRRLEKVPESPETDLSREIVVHSGASGSNDPRLERLPDGHVSMRDAVGIANSMHTKSVDAEVDLGSLEQLFELYRFVFKANPVGSENQEIMAQLLGSNAKKLVSLSEGPLFARCGGRVARQVGGALLLPPALGSADGCADRRSRWEALDEG